VAGQESKHLARSTALSGEIAQLRHSRFKVVHRFSKPPKEPMQTARLSAAQVVMETEVGVATHFATRIELGTLAAGQDS
jgi:hypothetical protein